MSQNRTIVSASWLKDNLHNSEVKIIDCRFRLTEPDWGYQQYQHSHIENAYYLHLNHDLSSPVQHHGGRHPLPNINELSQKLASRGIMFNRTLVVVYDDSRFAFASRLWWLLRYLGHQKVAILDGGWQEWVNLNYPVTNVLPPTDNGSFTPVIQEDMAVDISYVRQYASSPSKVLVDARSCDRYSGKKEPFDRIAGCIPHAKNLFWQEMTTETGKLKSIPQLESLWLPYGNFSEIIMYCGSGVTACVNIFALNAINISKSRLYVGGWSDWCSYLD